MPAKSFAFRARLEKVWLMRCVTIPPKISAALGGGKGRIPVRGWIEDLPVQSTLTPSGNGRHRLVVNSRIWRPLKLKDGDQVTVVLQRDDAPERFTMLEEFSAALAADAEARRNYMKETPAMRRQIATYVAGVKNPVSREKRIAHVLERLRAGPMHKPRRK